MSRLLHFCIGPTIAKLSIASFILFSPSISFAETNAAPSDVSLAPSDVRIVVDISGSMKKNDPHNLRKPAIDLMLRLLPDNSKVGIWTFGQSVNMLVPYRDVDAQWRELATQKINEINSIAQFTNIGSALETATESTLISTDTKTRNIILLTDGVVDISKEAVDNIKERRRILNEVLPQLKKSNFRIHTIALSDDADQELLQQLSLRTDAISEVADSAKELTAIFLRIFDQAVPAERVPLDEKGFLIDASIQEFTALIFPKETEKGKKAPDTVLISPEGKKYTPIDLVPNIHWHSTDTYDLITVQKPQSGQWQLASQVAPDSRVTVVSDLQLVVDPLKTNIEMGEVLNLAFSFKENNQLLTNKDLLNLLSSQAVIKKEGVKAQDDSKVEIIPIAQESLKDGIFKSDIKTAQQPGSYSLKLAVDGKTFKREYVHQFSINSLFTLAEVDIASSNQSAAASSSVESIVSSSSIASSEANSSEENTSASSSSIAAKAEEPEKPEEEKKSNLWLYIALGIGNLLLIAIGYLVYRLLFGKNKKENNEDAEEASEEKSDEKAKSKTKAGAGKHDENPFPLDNLEDSDGNKNKKT